MSKVEEVAKALWRLECQRSDEDERRAGRAPPKQWADPWHPSGCGVRQQRIYLEEARAAIEAHEKALAENGYVMVPRVPTDTMCDFAAEVTALHRDCALDVWVSMIDAAPKESEQEQ